MWNRLQSAIRRLGSSWTDDDLANPQLAAPLIKVGNTWRVEKQPTITGNNINAGVANGTALTLYTVTPGTLPVVYFWRFQAGGAGNIALRYNAVVIDNVIAVAGGVYTATLPKAWVGLTTGGIFDIFNSSGAAMALSGSIILAEYTP